MRWTKPAASEGYLPFEMADVTGDAAIALTDLRRFRDADASFHDAAGLFAEQPPLNQARYLGWQTSAALRASKPDLAAQLMCALVPIVPMVTSAHLDESIRDILRASTRWRSVSEVREARDLLRAMTPPREQRAPKAR